MTSSSKLFKFLKKQIFAYNNNKNNPDRSAQEECLRASTTLILHNPLALKPYSWALSIFLHSYSNKESLMILNSLIKAHPKCKGFVKLLRMYCAISDIEKESYSLQYVRVMVDNSFHFLESDFLYSWGSLQMLSGRHHEPSTIQLMKNILSNQGGSVVHAGSCYGDMLPALSRACKQSSRVYAFEPVLNSYVLSKKTVSTNSLENVHLFNFGLAESFFSAYITTSDQKGLKLGGRSFISDASEEDDKNKSKKELINVIPLDSIDIPSDLALIHLDIEGSEVSALRGARQTIIKKKPIILIEIAKAQTKHYDAIKDLMSEMNYMSIRPIPSISVWIPSDLCINSSWYDDVLGGEYYDNYMGLMIQKDWLSDCDD